MAGAKNHDYHILPPDIWPLVGAASGLTFTSGMVLNMHDMANAHLVLGLGVAGLIATFFAWFTNIVKEAQSGDHTPVVQLHLRYGMILFIASEVMFFVGWFWSWFDFALFPAPLTYDEAAGLWSNIVGQEGADAARIFPNAGIHVLDAFDLPLLNTLILLTSGTTVTWAHHALIHGDRDGLKKGLWLTIVLGALFTCIQAYEYSHAPFAFGGVAYSSAFYMATGFHGFHVLVGMLMLLFITLRLMKGHFTPQRHFGFEGAAWYWHFVDVVWLGLYFLVYWL